MIKILLLLITIFSFSQGAATISKKTYENLLKVEKLIEKNEYKNAENILTPMLETKNDIAKSYVLQSLSNIYIAKEDYKKVAHYYEEIIKLAAFKKEILENIKFSLSQIYLSDSLYAKCIKTSLELVNSKIVKQEFVYQNLAYAYYNEKNYKKTIFYVKKNIANKVHKESLYRLLYSSYLELKDNKNLINTLEYMIAHYSDKEEYWIQLIATYQKEKLHKKALATIEIAYDKNIIDRKRYTLYFASILIEDENYNKVAILLENAIKNKDLKLNKRNFNLMVSSHINAKNYEKVIKILKSKRFIKFARTPRYSSILGNIFYNEGKYEDVIATLLKSKFKKHSKINGQRYTLLALAFYELDNKKESKKFLRKAFHNKHERRRAKNIAKELNFKI